jgi:hypothetical protein
MRAATWVVLVVGIGCGGGEPRPAPPPNGPPQEPIAGEAGDDDEGGTEAPPASTWLRDLGEGETLTYHVTVDDGREVDLRFTISEVVRRGDGVAVRLSPIGTPLLDSPVFARWMVADADTLYGLEETASLTQPGFEPIDARGGIVTEARDAIAWRVELGWAEGTAASALGSGATDGGWRVEGHQQSVEGAVRGARCVRMRRQEGELTTRMLVCANLGLVELSRTGGDESDAQSWRLVDVGDRPEEVL